jgi:hypothetical protein
VAKKTAGRDRLHMRKFGLFLGALAAGSCLFASPAHASGPSKYLTSHQEGSQFGPSTLLATVNGTGPRALLVSVTGTVVGGRNQMLDIRVVCGNEWNRHTTNITPAAPVTVGVRVLSSTRDCEVYGYAPTTFPKPELGIRVTVRWTQTPVSTWVTNNAFTAHPSLLPQGKAADVLPTVTDVEGDTVTVYGDIKLTACTATGGSRENGSENLCVPSLVSSSDHKVRVTVAAMQMKTDGGYCNIRSVKSTNVAITRNEHHESVLSSARFTLSRAPGCTSTVRAKIYVSAVKGNVVIHSTGTQVGIYQ